MTAEKESKGQQGLPQLPISNDSQSSYEKVEEELPPENNDTLATDNATAIDYSKYTSKKRPWNMHPTDFVDIVSQDYPGKGTVQEPYIISWLEHDGENPRAFPMWKVWYVTICSAVMTVGVALASSAYSGAVGPLMKEFNTSDEVVVLGMSMMVLGYAIGPLVWGPISEVYGRREVYLITFAIYTMWTAVTCASQNFATVVVFRAFAGIFGSSALVVPGGQIADMFPAETRGLGIGVFCAAPFIGPSVGPLVGGFLGDAAGWRWVFGLLGIFSAALTVMGFFTLPETYAPTMLRRRAHLLSQVTGKSYISVIDSKKPLDINDLMKKALVRPWVLLFREPIVLVLSIYMSCVYGTLYMCFGAFPIVFQRGRGWSAGIGGLSFMGVFVGFMIGVVIVCLDNRRFVKLLKENNGHPPPECRLPPAIIGGGFIVIGLAWFAATDGPDVHWASPIVAGIPFAVGFVLVFVCLGNYLVDAYVVYAASVIAGNGVMRSTFGAVFPLFTKYMFEDIGVHWGMAVPGFIALACFPFPILFYYYGYRLREKCKYAAEAAKVLEEMKKTTGGGGGGH